MTEQEKILDKLQKIKAHADSAKAIGSEAEAQAFAEMLQKLLLKHKLAMSDIDFERQEKDEPIEQFMVDWQDVRVRKVRVAWIEALASLIARAHFCRIVVHRNSSRITLVGRNSDVKVAEYMLVVLTRTIERLSNQAYNRYYAEHHIPKAQQKSADERELPGEARGFRSSWITAFVQRLAERFHEERAATEASSSTALVRLNKADAAVKEYMNSRRWGKASIIRGARNDNNAAGHRAGRAAADSINLRGKAVEGSSRAQGQLR